MRTLMSSFACCLMSATVFSALPQPAVRLSADFSASPLANSGTLTAATFAGVGTTPYSTVTVTRPNGIVSGALKMVVPASADKKYIKVNGITSISASEFTLSLLASRGTMNYFGLLYVDFSSSEFFTFQNRTTSDGGVAVFPGSASLFDGSTASFSAAPLTPLTDTNTQFLMTITAKDGLMSLYVNGAFYASKAYTPAAGTTFKTLNLGTLNTDGSGTRNFGGTIDDFRLYTTGFSAAQVQELYTEMLVSTQRSINVNFGAETATGEGAIVATTPVTGAETIVDGIFWQNALSFGTDKTLELNHRGVASGATLTYTSVGTWGSNASSCALLRRYISNRSPGWSVSVAGIPYRAFDVYAIFASDQGANSPTYSPVCIDGSWYYGGTGATLSGENSWIGQGYNADGTALVEGKNYLKTRVLSRFGEPLTLSTKSWDGNNSSPNLLLAGLQIIEAPLPAATDTYTRTLSTGSWFDAASWSSGETTGLDWVNSTADRAAKAILSAESDTIALTLNQPAVLDSLTVGPAASFTLSGTGPLTVLNSSIAALDLSGVTGGSTISAPISSGSFSLAAGTRTAFSNPDTLIRGDLTLSSGTFDAAFPGTITGALKMTGGTLKAFADTTFTHAITQTGGTIAPDGHKLTLAGNATLLAQTMNAAGSSLVFSGATSSLGTVTAINGEIEFSSGTTIVNGNLRLEGSAGVIRICGDANVTANTFGSGAGNSSATAIGKLEITGGTLRIIGTEKSQVAGGNSTTSHGSILQSGGKVIIDATNDDNIRIGHWAHGGVGSLYELSGGELQMEKALLNIAVDAPATFRMTGGTASLKGLKVSGSEPGNLDLTGGVLTLGAGGISKATAATVSSVNLGHVTFKSSASWSYPDTLPATLGDAGDGTIFAPSSGQMITFSGALSGDGRLVVAGPGTLALRAANTYTGGTELRGGTLSITAAGQIPANSTFTLSGGTLAATATSTVTGLTLDGGTIPMTLTGFPSGGLFAISGGGTLTIGENETTLAVTSGDLPEGTYTLASGFSNTVTDDHLKKIKVEHSLNTTIFSVELKAYNGALTLTIAKQPGLFWANSAGGDWSNNPSDLNWKNLSDETVAFSAGENIYFEAIEETEAIIVNVTEAVNPGLLFFRNDAATAYTLSGPGGITGLTGLQKTMPGSVTLATSNTFAGDTSIAAGSVTVSGSLGTVQAPYPGAINVAGGASFIVDSATDQVYSGLLGGGGSFLKKGTGALTLGGFDATAPASTTIESGILTLLSTGTVSNPITVNAPATLAFAPAQPFTLATVVSGDGVMAVNSGELTIGISQSNFKGQLRVTGGTVKLNAATGTHGSGTGIFGDPIYKTKYPVFISGSSTVVELIAQEVTGWDAAQAGYFFAEMKEGATFRKVSQTQNLRRSFLFSGDASLVNAHTSEGWKICPGAVFKVTAGTTTISSTGSSNGVILTDGTAANPRVIFDVAEGAELLMATGLGSTGTDLMNSGIRKTGSGTLRYTAASANAGRATAIEEGSFVNNGAATGAGTYTIGTASTTATLSGTGSFAGDVTVKAGSTLETGLGMGKLTLESGSFIRLLTNLEDAPITTTTCVAEGLIKIDSSRFEEPVALPVPIIKWSGAIPAARFALTGPLAATYGLQKTPEGLMFASRQGILIRLF